VTTGTGDFDFPKKTAVKVFPNPTTDLFRIEFSLEKKSLVEISIIDVEAKPVKLLLKDVAAEGKNLFSFNKGALSAGIYFLQVKTEQKIEANEKIVIQ
jgi:hypothetical protein